MEKTAENGDKVSVHYTGKLEDGSIFDTSKGKSPLDFILGKKMVVPGFENGVVGMKEGEEKTLNIEPEDAYGKKMPELERDIPKEALGEEIKPEIGMMLQLVAPTGQRIPATIMEIGDKTIKVDLNHPLAEKKLTFEVKLEKVTKAEDIPPEELKEDDHHHHDGDHECTGCGKH